MGIIYSVIVSNENGILTYDIMNVDNSTEHYTEINVPDSIIRFINYDCRLIQESGKDIFINRKL